jgi:hypothetical protein
MRIHDVRARRSADNFPRTEHLAWTRYADDNQFDSDIYNFALEGVTL